MDMVFEYDNPNTGEKETPIPMGDRVFTLPNNYSSILHQSNF